uniref:Uncharacterized protein n=1 Tax=Romanomermis culicivorax TaxID=13658 RepID=A0A915KMA2_ROMCU
MLGMSSHIYAKAIIRAKPQRDQEDSEKRPFTGRDGPCRLVFPIQVEAENVKNACFPPKMRSLYPIVIWCCGMAYFEAQA